MCKEFLSLNMKLFFFAKQALLHRHSITSNPEQVNEEFIFQRYNKERNIDSTTDYMYKSPPLMSRVGGSSFLPWEANICQRPFCPSSLYNTCQNWGCGMTWWLFLHSLTTVWSKKVFICLHEEQGKTGLLSYTVSPSQNLLMPHKFLKTKYGLSN